MSRMILILTAFLFFCGQVVAKQRDMNASNEPPNVVALAQEDASVETTAESTASETNSNSDAKSAPGPASAPPSFITTRKLPPVGYIDSAIVGSQVRLRFDAAFHMANPDLAEFFYAKCGCFADIGSPGDSPNDPRNSQFDANAAGPGPGNATNINFQQAYINVEYAPSQRFSIFTDIPIRSIQYLSYGAFFPAQGESLFSKEAGISDVSVGFKFAMIASPRRYLTFQEQATFPSGNASLGLGTNHFTLEPALLFHQELSNRWAIDSEISDSHPIGGSAGIPASSPQGFAGDVLFYGIGPSYVLFSGKRLQFTPVLELVGWSVLGGFQTNFATGVSASGTNIVNLKIGARTSFGDHSSVYVGFGQALTSADWYRKIVRVEYRYSF